MMSWLLHGPRVPFPGPRVAIFGLADPWSHRGLRGSMAPGYLLGSDAALKFCHMSNGMSTFSISGFQYVLFVSSSGQ